MSVRSPVWSDRGQALVEFALGLPLVLLASFYAFGLLDAVLTQEAVEAAARRAALALAGSNDDAQARGAASDTSWLRGQSIGVTIVPDGSQQRCGGAAVTISVSAAGHLGFLLPVATTWTATQPGTIENAGPQAVSCP
ncbi:MAG TPA: hypothetical protein VGA38_03290 [Candidatus Limnocylindria bacterium]